MYVQYVPTVPSPIPKLLKYNNFELYLCMYIALPTASKSAKKDPAKHLTKGRRT